MLAWRTIPIKKLSRFGDVKPKPFGRRDLKVEVATVELAVRKSPIKTVIFIAGSYKGSTDDFDSSSVGSSPAPAARYAGVAEWHRHLTQDQGFGGSNPFTGTITPCLVGSAVAISEQRYHGFCKFKLPLALVVVYVNRRDMWLSEERFIRTQSKTYTFARMVELVDTPLSKSGLKGCGFKSHFGYHIKNLKFL